MNEMMVSCFFSDDLKLRAEVHYYNDLDGHFVKLFEDDQLSEIKHIADKSIGYIEDCCEDYTKRISGPLDQCSSVLY